jgi:hypothetical protein
MHSQECILRRGGTNRPKKKLKLTGAAILIFRASMFLQATPTAEALINYPISLL